MSVIFIIATGAILFIVLRILFFIARISGKRHSFFHALTQIIPAFEFTVWIVFVFWAIYNLFISYTFMPFIIAAMAVVLFTTLGWYVIRDLVSGVVLKTENGFKPGQYIKTPLAEGIIKRTGYLSIELETTNGEYIKIPYSKLINQALTKPFTEKSYKYAMIKLNIPGNFPHREIKERILSAVSSTPWVIYNRPPEIQIKQINDSTAQVEVRFLSFSDEYINQLKSFLDEYCKNNFSK